LNLPKYTKYKKCSYTRFDENSEDFAPVKRGIYQNYSWGLAWTKKE
jgi:hypothetical protein